MVMVCINKSTKIRLLSFFITATASTILCTGTATATDRFLVQNAFLPTGRPIAAPTAFLEMCSRSPEDCRQSDKAEPARIVSLARQAMVEKYELAFAHLTGTDPTPGAVDTPQWPRLTGNRLIDATQAATPVADYVRIDLDRDAMTILKTVNRRVNHDLIADTDAHVYQVNDYWEAPALTRGARGDCEDFALVKRRLLIAAGIPATALSLAIVRTRYGEDHAVLVVATRQGDFVLDNLASRVRPWQKTGYDWVSRQGPGDDLGWVSLTPVPSAVPMRAMRIAYNR